jgi:hypothetical protein
MNSRAQLTQRTKFQNLLTAQSTKRHSKIKEKVSRTGTGKLMRKSKVNMMKKKT